MPASPHSSSTGAADVVVVEEYRALAAAIRSALRKFAPDRAIALVESLAAADRLLAESEPDLLIVDVDPPQRGAVAFFDRIRDAHPDLRVLIITATPAADALPRCHWCALHFVAKPFDLAAFGAAVQRLLTTAPAVAEPVGTLSDLALADMLALQAHTDATSVLLVTRDADAPGEIHFARGQIIHAIAGDYRGLRAIEEMREWPAPRFASRDKDPETPRTIHSPAHEVITGAAKPLRTAPKPRRARSTRRRGNGKKVLVVDDTETLRVFVEEVLATADPTLQISTAANGADGVHQAIATVPDLVLLDYSLPDINGDEVCRRLLADETTARVPVLMMSGHVPEMNAAAAEFENVVATLAKPFLSSALIELVQATLQKPPAFGKGKQPAAITPTGHDIVPQAESSDVRAAPPNTEPEADPPEPTKQIGDPVAARAEPPPQPESAPEPATEVSAVLEPPVTSMTSARETLLTPARLTHVSKNDVIVGLPLEVTSLQFSPTLQIAAIRARPTSRLVSLHVDPAGFGVRMPDAGFELEGVHLDTRGQMETLRLAPAKAPLTPLAPGSAVGIGDVNVLRSNGHSAVQLVPTAVAPMRLQLLAPFELAAVELTPAFGVAHLVLRWRGGKMRVTLQPERAESGATFDTAQVLLDHSANIAELLFDAIA